MTDDYVEVQAPHPRAGEHGAVIATMEDNRYAVAFDLDDVVVIEGRFLRAVIRVPAWPASTRVTDRSPTDFDG